MKKNLALALCLLSLFSYAQNHTGNVGINTDEPIEKLHVNGTMQVDDIKFDEPLVDLGPSEEYTFLVKDKSTQKIQTYNTLFNSDGNNTAPLNLIQFKIKTDNSDSDWVNKFDTKINSEKYVAIVSSFGFNTGVEGSENYGPLHQIYTYANTSTNITAKQTITIYNSSDTSSQIYSTEVKTIVFDVLEGIHGKPANTETVDYITISNKTRRRVTKREFNDPVISQNTWKLKADYDGFTPNSSSTGEWTINLLVFDRNYAKMQSEQTINMNRSTTGSGNLFN